MTDKPELQTRKAIYEAIVRSPGIHLREIERSTNLPLGVVRYHVDRLQKEDLIFVQEDLYYKRFFPRGKIPNVPTETFAVLHQESLRRIVLQLLETPGATHTALKEALGLPASTLSTYLSILVDKNVVRRERKGKENLYYIVDEDSVMKVLIVYRPTFLDRLVDHAIEIYLGR